MRGLIVLISLSVLSASVAYAAGSRPDSLAVTMDTCLADTLSVSDSTGALLEAGMTYDSLLHCLGGSLHMTDSLSVAMEKQIEKNKARKFQGYRVRIYFDNSQDARVVSEQIADTFAVRYPDVPVYRIYDNPYFKVTVGDFRSKSDAMRFLEAIRKEYPTVFLVKESFSTI